MNKTGLLLLIISVFTLGFLASHWAKHPPHSSAPTENAAGHAAITSTQGAPSAPGVPSGQPMPPHPGQQAGTAGVRTTTNRSAQFPGSQPSAATQSPEQQAKVIEQRQTVRKLNQEVSQIENNQNQRQAKLDELGRQIQAQSSEVQRLIEDRNSQKNDQYQNYMSQVQQAQRQEVDRATQAAQLQDQLAQSQARLNLLSQKIQYMAQWRIESDALKDARDQYEEEMKRYKGIQDSLVQARAQAGQAVSMNQLKQDWQQKAQQEEFQSEFLPQLQRAQARLQELQDEYQQLQKQDVDQRSRLGDLTQQLDDAQDTLREMTAHS